MLCPKCNTSNPGDSAFCIKCGAPLISIPPTAPSVSNTTMSSAPIVQDTKTTMFCRNCGKGIAPQAITCVYCGCDPKSGKIYCHNCGKGTNSNAEICTSCGVRLTSTKDKMRVASQDAWKAFKVLGVNPVGGLLPAFESLDKARAMGVGIVFAIVFDICIFMGMYVWNSPMSGQGWGLGMLNYSSGFSQRTRIPKTLSESEVIQQQFKKIKSLGLVPNAQNVPNLNQDQINRINETASKWEDTFSKNYSDLTLDQLNDLRGIIRGLENVYSEIENGLQRENYRMNDEEFNSLKLFGLISPDIQKSSDLTVAQLNQVKDRLGKIFLEPQNSSSYSYPRGSSNFVDAIKQITMKDFFQLILFAAIPFLSIVLASFLVRKSFHGMGGIEGDMFIAGSALLPMAVVILVSGILFGILDLANVELMGILSVFSLCYTILILYSGCTKISKISEAVSACTVPIMILLSGWLTKIVLTNMF